MNQTNPIIYAAQFAVAAHRRVNHLRKYTNLPYETHLGGVAGAYQAHPRSSEDRLCAIWLHDIIEDKTGVTYDDLLVHFGVVVTGYVRDLTNTSKELFPGYNRKQRKVVDIGRLSNVCADSKIMKVFDRQNNVDSLTYDFLRKVHPDVTSGYCRMYAGESIDLIDGALHDCGDEEILARLRQTCLDLIRFTREEDQRLHVIAEIYHQAHALHVFSVKQHPGRVPVVQAPILQQLHPVEPLSEE